MAEALAKKMAPQHNTSSAGLYALGGERPSAEAVQTMEKEYGVDISAYRARQATADMVARADLVLTMTEAQAATLSASYPQFSNKIHPLVKYAFGKGGDVPDPYGMGIGSYIDAAAELEKMVAAVLEKIGS